MTQETGGAVKPNYLKSAIGQIYGDEDDLVILGLTGRTGSGCSTVAKILQSAQTEVRHSLYSGENPDGNVQRKERILSRHFKATWTPFLLIQVRTLITTFLLDTDASVAASALDSFFATDSQRTQFTEFLDDLRTSYQAISKGEHSADPERYYTKELPEKCDQLRDILGESGYVHLYQKIGKNIRISGDPYKEELEEGKFFTLADRIDKVIKLIHDQRKARGEKKTFLVIDAIRSPLEALLLQERHSSFLLMAVSAPEEHRQRRLRNLNHSQAGIKSIDDNEYTTRDPDKPDFYTVQDIQSCLQRADLYISNPDVLAKVNEFQNLANQVIRFVSLIRKPGIVTPSPIERCMQMAYTAKLNSGCISRQVGAVVTDINFSIRSIGWNDAPHGQVPCNLRNRDDLLAGSDSTAYSKYEKTSSEYLAHFANSSAKFIKIADSGRNNSFCFKSEYNTLKKEKNQVHTRSLHAEENAFLQISKYGLASIEGGILFTTASPCELCAKKAYQLGIKKIYFIDPYPGIALDHILQGGTMNPELLLFYGAIGRAFHKLFSPIVAYKDELAALTA